MLLWLYAAMGHYMSLGQFWTFVLMELSIVVKDCAGLSLLGDGGGGLVGWGV